jgi:hypothetical protein
MNFATSKLKYTIGDQGGNKGKLQLEWENHVASVPITVKQGRHASGG